MLKLEKIDHADWLDVLAAGEEAGLAHFFKLHQKSLGYFAYKVVGDSDEAEDIVATCFVKLWEHRTEFPTPEKLKSFLYVSCRNACLNHLRNLKVQTSAQQNYFRELEGSERDVLYRIVESEVLQELHKEIELLPDNYREVFCKIYFQHQKTDEIAAELGLSVQTVRNYKARAVELLRNSMLKKGLSEAFTVALLFLGIRNI